MKIRSNRRLAAVAMIALASFGLVRPCSANPLVTSVVARVGIFLLDQIASYATGKAIDYALGFGHQSDLQQLEKELRREIAENKARSGQAQNDLRLVQAQKESLEKLLQGKISHADLEEFRSEVLEQIREITSRLDGFKTDIDDLKRRVDQLERQPAISDAPDAPSHASDDVILQEYFFNSEQAVCSTLLVVSSSSGFATTKCRSNGKRRDYRVAVQRQCSSRDVCYYEAGSVPSGYPGPLIFHLDINHKREWVMGRACNELACFNPKGL